MYNKNEQRTKTNKNIVFFARPEMPRRCYELGIEVLKIVKNKLPDVEIIFYGSSNVNKNRIKYDVTFKDSLPSIKDLANLYRNADLGICFSTTNPSLVPYEMMACGLPVVDLDVNDSVYKYGSKDNVFLLNPIPELMANDIVKILNDEEGRKTVAENGYNYSLKNFISEHEMGKRVESIILDKMKLGV